MHPGVGAVAAAFMEEARGSNNKDVSVTISIHGMLCSLVLKIQFMVFVLARGGTGREEIGGRWKEEGAKVGEIENENEKEYGRERGEAGKEGIMKEE